MYIPEALCEHNCVPGISRTLRMLSALGSSQRNPFVKKRNQQGLVARALKWEFGSLILEMFLAATNRVTLSKLLEPH